MTKLGMSVLVFPLLALAACSSSEPSTDAGAAADASSTGDAGAAACVPAHEPAGPTACDARRCSGIVKGANGVEVVVCTRKCTDTTGCGAGEVCAKPWADEPQQYCFLRCDDPRCKAPLVCNKTTNACAP